MNRISKVSALVASATTLPLADNAAAQTFSPVVPGTMTYTFEGGISFADFGKSDFPGGAAGFIPQDLDKVGSPPLSSGDLGIGRRTGGYGSFSVARNINGIYDWRFSAGFTVFGTANHSANASEHFTGLLFSPTNTAAVTESDRFGLYTADFDFGRNYSAGIFKVRAFAGLRSLYIDDRFDWAVHTEGTDKTGIFRTTTVTDTLSQGRSTFFGVGPRVGLDFFTGSTFGVVGSISEAIVFGSRRSNVPIMETFVINGGAPTFGSNSVSNRENLLVGNISGSLGVAWQFSPTGQLVIGYKLDQWYNVRDKFDFAGLACLQLRHSRALRSRLVCFVISYHDFPPLMPSNSSR
jgi:Legionella pneumophila major outer membrane protein precursor